jgi:hypothetical protein
MPVIESDAGLSPLVLGLRTVLVVGCSPSPARDSHGVARYLQDHGLRIVPVHPAGGMILGEPVYGSVSEAISRISPDVIDVFRRPEALPELVEELVAVTRAPLWFQFGVRHPRAEALALEAGFDLVLDKCLLVEHRRLTGA